MKAFDLEMHSSEGFLSFSVVLHALVDELLLELLNMRDHVGFLGCVQLELFGVHTEAFGQEDRVDSFDWFDESGDGRVDLVGEVPFMIDLFAQFHVFFWMERSR